MGFKNEPLSPSKVPRYPMKYVNNTTMLPRAGVPNFEEILLRQIPIAI